MHLCMYTHRETQTQHLQPLKSDTNAAKPVMTDKQSAIYPEHSTKQHIHLLDFSDLNMYGASEKSST